MGEMRQALTVQGRVIYALILREARGKYGKSKIGYLWALIEPILQVLILVSIFSALGRQSPVGGELAIFFTTGLLPWMTYSAISSKLSGAFGANQALMAYPQVTSIDVLIGRAMLEGLTMWFVFALILGILDFVGQGTGIYDLFLVLTAMIGISLFGLAIGMINASIRIYFDSWDKIFSACNRPLYFLSGIFFTASSLPISVRSWLEWNPIFQYVEWTRAGFFSTYTTNYINFSYTIGVTLILLFIGLLGATLTKDRARNLN